MTVGRPTTGEFTEFGDFVAQLSEQVPGLPSTANDSFNLSRTGLLSHAQRTIVRAVVSRMVPSAVWPAVDGAGTLGELWSLVEHHQTDSAPPSRAAYDGIRVYLRPYRDADFPNLYDAMLDPRSTHRFGYRGRTPSQEVARSELFNNTLAQFMVCDSSTHAALGLVTAYNDDLGNGHASLAFIRSGSDEQPGGGLVEGMAVFITYLFDHWPLRKLYAEIPAFNRYLLDNLLPAPFHIEGTLRDHLFFCDAYWDLLIVALDRDGWTRFIETADPGAVRPAPETAPMVQPGSPTPRAEAAPEL